MLNRSQRPRHHPLQAISANLRGPALRQAEDLLRGVTETPLAVQLCGCVEDARADSRGQGAEAAAQVGGSTAASGGFVVFGDRGVDGF